MGAVRRRQAEGRRRELWMEPRPATRLPQAGGGGARTAVTGWKLGIWEGEQGPSWGPLENMGAAVVPVGTVEAAGPGVALIVSKDSSQQSAER